jgi:hypothetical protein
MSVRNPQGRYLLAALQRMPAEDPLREYVDHYFDRYARFSKENPPSEEDMRLHALLYQRSTALHHERHSLASKIVGFLRANGLLRWLASVRRGPQ